MSNIEYRIDNGFHVIKIKGKSRLVPIVREEEEFFSDTVIRAQSKAKLTVCSNACWYSLTRDGYIDVVAGHDPVPAKDSINQGFVLLGTGKLYGGSSPLMFYIAQKQDYSWYMGQGDLNNKQGFYTGIGGLCPLIVNGLKYGISNTYNKTLTGAVLKGEPLPQHKKYLTQRSNSKYAALHAGDNRSGRAGLGVSATGEVIIVAQENGTGGATTYDDFRDIFVKNGCVNAGSTDGSDSVFLWYDGKFKFTAGNDKDESQTIGIGIRAES